MSVSRYGIRHNVSLQTPQFGVSVHQAVRMQCHLMLAASRVSDCTQAGVNCGVHCKCEDCHNTPEDGLPPPPRIPKAGSIATPQTALSGQADSTAYPSKTSPGTPPAT